MGLDEVALMLRMYRYMGIWIYVCMKRGCVCVWLVA